MNIKQGAPGDPIYISFREVKAGAVARTRAIVRGELMVDLDEKGGLLGIEVLTPHLVARVPEILAEYGLPRDARLELLAASPEVLDVAARPRKVAGARRSKAVKLKGQSPLKKRPKRLKRTTRAGRLARTRKKVQRGGKKRTRSAV